MGRKTNFKSVVLVVVADSGGHLLLSNRAFLVFNEPATEQRVVRWANFTFGTETDHILGQTDVVLSDHTKAEVNQYISSTDGKVHERHTVELVDIVFLPTMAAAVKQYPALEKELNNG